MKRYLMVAIVMLAAFLAAPVSGQTISGCGTTAIGKTEASDAVKLSMAADCFAKAKAAASAAEQARRDRITALAPPAIVKTNALGINVASVDYWSNEYTFANLLTGVGWVDTKAGWSPVPGSVINALGMPREVPEGKSYAIVMTPPAGVFNGQSAAVRCTWAGTGWVDVNGSRRNLVRGDHAISFDWPAAPAPEGNSRNWIILAAVTTADPVRDLDCREAALARDVVFAPQIIDSLKPFRVLRFLDWSAANTNPVSVTWADRVLPAGINQADKSRGVAIEHMLALAKAVDADPWFTIPWNADEDYVTRMATLVRDSLPAGRRAYVELGNEPWNYAFPLSHQIQSEGMAAGLDTNGFGAMLKRYGQKVAVTMTIWSKVFADRPQALVRVAGSQASNPWVTEQLLANAALMANVDAVAIAPYFDYDQPQPADADKAARLASLRKGQDAILAKVSTALDAVRAKGKRLITYEAGQHVTDFTTGGAARVQLVNRAPEMGDLYRSYIAAWKAKTGDLMTLYSATGAAGGGGAWGIREYAGQPVAETPKRAAVLEAAGK